MTNRYYRTAVLSVPIGIALLFMQGCSAHVELHSTPTPEPKREWVVHQYSGGQVIGEWHLSEPPTITAASWYWTNPDGTETDISGTLRSEAVTIK